jgi:hypothetical protein
MVTQMEQTVHKKKSSKPKKESVLILTEELPVNNYMRSFILAFCLFLVVTVLVNIRVQVIEYKDDKGHVVTRWVYPPAPPFILPQPKPIMPIDPGVNVEPQVVKEKKSSLMTVWRVFRFFFQIYN